MDDDGKDLLALVAVAVLVVAGGGLSFVAGAIFTPVQAFLSEAGLLVPADQAMFELADTGLGPSTWALLLLLGLVCLMIVIGPMMHRTKGRDRR